MATSAVLTGVIPTWPVGTTVAAYPATNWAPTKLPPEGAPVGSATASAAVQAAGTVTFTGLTAELTYFATANVSGYKYQRFVVKPTTNPTKVRL